MWEGPIDPLQFVRDVVSRALAVQGWMQKSIQGQLLQDNLNLSELFHPDTFLSALKQQTAR
jgi:dynein heavy chain 2